MGRYADMRVEINPAQRLHRKHTTKEAQRTTPIFCGALVAFTDVKSVAIIGAVDRRLSLRNKSHRSMVSHKPDILDY